MIVYIALFWRENHRREGEKSDFVRLVVGASRSDSRHAYL
jgi:hypothetical protein